MTTMNFSIKAVRLPLFGLALVASACAAMATLGKAPSVAPPAASTSAPASVTRLSAAAISSRSSLYELHEVQLENGTTVREYATPAGLVFAVSWRGPVLPDLSALLGDYFNIFKVETDQARLGVRRGSPVNIERDGLVVRSNGRMRNFFGSAYAPALVPAGVEIKDVLQ